MRLLHALLPVLLLAACGEVTSQSGADAAGPDDPPDGGGMTPTTDAPAAGGGGSISVTVLSSKGDGAPVSGATIVVTDGGGTRTATTASDGKATIQAMPGATVTAVVRAAKTATLTSIFGAQPGESLLFGERGTVAASPGTMKVFFPKFDIPGLIVDKYHVYNGCQHAIVAGDVNAAEIDFTGCSTGINNIEVVAVDKSKTVFATNSKSEPFIAGGPVLITTQWTPAEVMTATYSNVPFDASSISLRRWERNGDQRYHNMSKSIDKPTSTQVVEAVIPSFAEEGTVVTTLFGGLTRVQAIGETVPTSKSYTMGLDGLLPWLDDPKIDNATRTVTWTETAGAASDVTVATVQYTAGETKIVWRTFAPPAAKQVTLPELPTELDALALVAATPVKHLAVRRYDFPDMSSYDALRPTVDAEFGEAGSFETNGKLGKRSRLRVSGVAWLFLVPIPF